jgi:hypothetical protein
MSDASNTSLRRKRRLISGRQLASRKRENDENAIDGNGINNNNNGDDATPGEVSNGENYQQQQHHHHRSKRTAIKETAHQHKKKKREVNERMSKTSELNVPTVRHHKRTSVVVKQEDDIVDQQQQLRSTKDTLKVKVKSEPSSAFDNSSNGSNSIHIPLKARFFPPNTPQLDMAHAKRFLPLYTVQLDTTASSSSVVTGLSTHTTGSIHSITGESTTSNGHSAFFVIDLQVRHLLDLPSHLTLFARYPDLQRRPVGQREKERFWGPLAYMLMANLHSDRSASPQPLQTSNTLEWKEQEKQRFLATDLYFVRLDDVASFIRRDYPYLSEQLITIKLDLGFSDENSSICIRNNEDINDPMMIDSSYNNANNYNSSTVMTSTLNHHHHQHHQHHHQYHTVSPVMNNPTFSLPAKFAMKLNKQLNLSSTSSSNHRS